MSNITQIDMDGNEIFSSSVNCFAENKSEAKLILGSAELFGKNKILVGDSKNKRIFVLNNSDVIEWEYVSDRFIMDARYSSKDNVTVEEINNEFIFIEGDGMDSCFTSSIIKINYWGKKIFQLNGMTSPRDLRVASNNKIIVSV